MFKRDRIFYAACCLTGLGVILAVMGYDLGILLFVAAYLLRPAPHEFGLAKQYADERQLVIHSRSGDIAFFVTPLSCASACLFLGSGKEDRVISGRTRTAVFGSLAAVALPRLSAVGFSVLDSRFPFALPHSVPGVGGWSLRTEN